MRNADKCYGLVERPNSQTLTIELIPSRKDEDYVLAFAQVKLSTLKDRQGIQAIVTSEKAMVTSLDTKAYLKIPELTQQKLDGYKLAIVLAPVKVDNIMLLKDRRNHPSQSVLQSCILTPNEENNLQRFPQSQFQVVFIKGQGNLVIQNGRAKQLMNKCYGIVGRADSSNSPILRIDLVPRHRDDTFVAVLAQVRLNTLNDRQGLKAVMVSKLVQLGGTQPIVAGLKVPELTEPLNGYKLALLITTPKKDNVNLILDPRNYASSNVEKTCSISTQDDLNLQRLPLSEFQVIFTKGKRNNILIRNGLAEKVRR